MKKTHLFSIYLIGMLAMILLDYVFIKTGQKPGTMWLWNLTTYLVIPSVFIANLLVVKKHHSELFKAAIISGNMRKLIRVFSFLAFLLFSNQAFSQSYNISFSFPTTGSTGTISFNYPTSCSHCQVNLMNNFNANFQVSGKVWNQTDIVTPLSPTLYLEFDTATNQWFFDDSNPAVLDGTTVLVFNNGVTQLSFAKGISGVAQLNGIPIVGNFIAVNTPFTSVPTLSFWALLLLVICLIFVSFSSANFKQYKLA